MVVKGKTTGALLVLVAEVWGDGGSSVTDYLLIRNHKDWAVGVAQSVRLA